LAEITPPTVASSANGGSSGTICRLSASRWVNSLQLTPAQTLMVRSRGSYCRTPRSDIVVTATSAGSTGPAMRRLVEFPASAMVRPAAAASRSASANSAGFEGASTLIE